MSQSNAAVVIPFPSVRHAQEQPRTAEVVAQEYLDAKRQAEEAKAVMEALAPELVALMQAEGRKGVSVSGAGRVALVTTGPGSRLDQWAAVTALLSAGLEVPMTPTEGGTSVRATLD